MAAEYWRDAVGCLAWMLHLVGNGNITTFAFKFGHCGGRVRQMGFVKGVCLWVGSAGMMAKMKETLCSGSCSVTVLCVIEPILTFLQ